jgi:hypothetical protein
LLKKRYALMAPLLDERRLRLYVDAEALTLIRRGIITSPPKKLPLKAGEKEE